MGARLTLLLIFGTSSCATMRAQIDIESTPERVWSILTELPAYATWNPFFVTAEGNVAVDRDIHLLMQPEGGSAREFSPSVLTVEQNKRIVWRGRLFMPGLFDGTHELTIERLDPQHIRFEQRESFSGLLVPFADFEPYRRGWLKMNAALKRRAELAHARRVSTDRRWTFEAPAAAPRGAAAASR